jgi:hypothetical protein
MVFIEDGCDEIFRKIGNAVFSIEPDDFVQLHAAEEVQFKTDVMECIDVFIQPILNHFFSTPELQDFLRRVESYRVTQ